MCFSWPLDFISSTVIQDKKGRNRTISVKEKTSLASDYSNSDQFQMELQAVFFIRRGR